MILAQSRERKTQNDQPLVPHDFMLSRAASEASIYFAVLPQ
jgi:hypothetical protein